MAAKKKIPPWKKKRPPGPKTVLSDADKSKARARAKKGGRRYPNLVDNMAIANEKKHSAKKTKS